MNPNDAMYYEISFPLTLTLKYNFVKNLLLITFISISISLKSSNILGNKSQVFGRSDCTIQGIIQKKSASGSWMLPCLIIFF